MCAAEEKEQVKRLQLQALEGPGGGEKARDDCSRGAQGGPAGPMAPASSLTARDYPTSTYLRTERPHRAAWFLPEG